MKIKSRNHQHRNVLIPNTLAGYEPTILCSVGRADDHCTTPPGHEYICLHLWVEPKREIIFHIAEERPMYTDNKFYDSLDGSEFCT
jgi:hypothetical protein